MESRGTNWQKPAWVEAHAQAEAAHAAGGHGAAAHVEAH
jgi:hypothetical protein